MLQGRYTVRVSIGNLRTTREDIGELWDLVRASTARLRAEAAA